MRHTIHERDDLWHEAQRIKPEDLNMEYGPMTLLPDEKLELRLDPKRKAKVVKSNTKQHSLKATKSNQSLPKQKTVKSRMKPSGEEIPGDSTATPVKLSEREFHLRKWRPGVKGGILEPENYRGKGERSYSFKLLQEVRETEPKVCICVTLYNEGIREFVDTIRGLFAAVNHLREYSKNILHQTLKETDIPIFFIQDGIAAMDQSLIEYLNVFSGIGLIDLSLINELARHKGEKEAFVINLQNNKKIPQDILWKEEESCYGPRNNILYLFSSTLHASHPKISCILPNSVKYKDSPPLHIFFGMKHFNKKKLDTHFWFFKGFCEDYLKPKYTLLVDLGTELSPDAITHLYKYLECRPLAAGICGEIVARTRHLDSNSWSLCENVAAYPVIWAQFIEYTIAHYLDKACESLFGFISVLPGAFSMYRLSAILPSNERKPQSCPLGKYLRGMHELSLGFMKANMYLAEDRVMCRGILVSSRPYFLAYIPQAVALTDTPTNMLVLLSQRKRWQNGSFFALWPVFKSFLAICKSRRGVGAKFALFFLLVFQIIVTFMSIMQVGTSYAMFSILVRNFYNYDETKSSLQKSYADACENIYLTTLFFTVIVAIGLKKPSLGKYFYGLITIIHAIGMFFSIYLLIEYISTSPPELSWALYGLYGMLACMFLPILLGVLRRPYLIIEYIVGFVCYVALIPFNFITINIYSFANTDNISWGNRPEAAVSSVSGQAIQSRNFSTTLANNKLNFQLRRVWWFSIWLLMNIFMGYTFSRALTTDYSNQGGEKYYTNLFLVIVIVAFIVTIFFIKLVAATIFWINHAMDICCGPEKAAVYRANNKSPPSAAPDAHPTSTTNVKNERKQDAYYVEHKIDNQV